MLSWIVLDTRARQRGMALLASAALLGSAMPSEAAPARRATPAEPAACAGLHGDLDNLSKSLALNFAEGMLNNTTAQKAVTEAKYNTLLERVRMTMDLMRDHRCRMPAAIPTGEQYVGSAIQCRSEMLKAEIARSSTLPPICNSANWVAEKH